MEVVDQEINELRRQLLCGGYADDMAGGLIPHWKLLIFISSTFTDTHRERDELFNILKELSALGDKHGIVVSFSDMRWGVPGTASLEHGTWMTCKQELKRCRDQSNGLFFLSLQSEKYLNIIHKLWLLLL